MAKGFGLLGQNKVLTAWWSQELVASDHVENR